MSWKEKAWKYATALTVAVIILNPEMAKIALFIDAVGLKMFILLLEVQIIAVFGPFFNTRIKPIYIYTKNLIIRHTPIPSWATIKNEPSMLVLSVPSPAFLMHLLVLSVAVSIVFNAY